MKPPNSHKRIREMEHELFQSELKPSVDDDLLSKIIRSSSSGENPHRAAAMESIFERSVLERRERVAARVRESLRSEPTPEPKRSNERSNNPIRSADPPAPVPAPKPVSRRPPKPQSTPRETPQKPVPRPEPTHSISMAEMLGGMGVHRTSVPNSRMSDSKPSSEGAFLVCSAKGCGGYGGLSGLKDGLYCGICPGRVATHCVNCGDCRSTKVKNCGDCGLKFMK